MKFLSGKAKRKVYVIAMYTLSSRNRHNKKDFVKHYLVNEALFFLFITSHLRPSLVCPLRVCLNLGEANDTVDSSVSNAHKTVLNVRFWWTSPRTLFKISKTITEPHISFTIYFKFIFFAANCDTFVQCCRTDRSLVSSTFCPT